MESSFQGLGSRRILSTVKTPSFGALTKRLSPRRDYFTANSFFDQTSAPSATRAWPLQQAQGPRPNAMRSRKPGTPLRAASQPHSTSSPISIPLTTPLDRRKRRFQGQSSSLEEPIAADDSTILQPPPSSTTSTTTRQSLSKLVAPYIALTKPRLTALIVLTSAASYSLYPTPTLLLPSSTISPSLSALTLLFLSAGTFLSSSSANALNMLLEPSHDAKMSRTRNRPLVRGLVSKRSALLFALLTGTLGVSSLYYGVNPTVAGLGAANIVLYAGIYTPLKRVSVVNTWVGALVGAIPPLMGWAAGAGLSASNDGGWRELLLEPSSTGGWLLASLLFAWQFPHFNALSWSIREEYRNAGYRMLAWVDPQKNARVSLRYAILMVPICAGLTAAGVTDRGFVVTSSVVNLWMIREAWRFWRAGGGTSKSARRLFFASVWHLPLVFVLAMAHKKGLWDGVWERWFGEVEEDEEETPSEEHV